MCSLTFDDAPVDLDVHQLMNEPMGNERQQLEPVMNDGQQGLEDDMPALQDRVARLVVKPIDFNDDAEHAKFGMRSLHDVLCDFKGGHGQMMTL